MSGIKQIQAVGAGSGAPLSSMQLMGVTPLFFAANMVAARWAEGAAIPPLFLAFGRWGFVFLLLLPLAAPGLWRHRRALAQNWRRMLLLAALGMGVAVAPQYIGVRGTSAANVALIFSACPLLVVLIEALVWKKPIELAAAVGLSLAVGGILLVLGKGDPAALFHLHIGRGDAWVMLAATGWALFTVVARRFPTPPMPAVVRLSALAGLGAALLAPFALFEAVGGTVPDFSDLRLYGAVGFLAIVPSIGAYSCYDRLIRIAGPSAASMSMYLVPVFAGLAAWACLGETLKPFHAAGFALIVGGVTLSTSRLFWLTRPARVRPA